MEIINILPSGFFFCSFLRSRLRRSVAARKKKKCRLLSPVSAEVGAGVLKSRLSSACFTILSKKKESKTKQTNKQTNKKNMRSAHTGIWWGSVIQQCVFLLLGE